MRKAEAAAVVALVEEPEAEHLPVALRLARRREAPGVARRLGPAAP